MAGVAWYDVKGGGWLRDIFVLLHPPYTLWHLSYIPIGAALAPRMDWALLGWTVLAFFLAMGIGGHFLDELNGRPLRTKIPTAVLGCTAVLSIAGAVAIGVFIGLQETLWLIPCILFGSFIVYAYNLEWPRDWARFGVFRELGLVGFFHHDFWFGFAWGSFPAITAYLAQAHTISGEIVLIAVFALLYSWAQRVLSLHARFWRRRVSNLTGDYAVRVKNNSYEWGKITTQTIIGPSETGLKLLNWGVIAAAVGLLLSRI